MVPKYLVMLFGYIILSKNDFVGIYIKKSSFPKIDFFTKLDTCSDASLLLWLWTGKRLWMQLFSVFWWIWHVSSLKLGSIIANICLLFWEVESFHITCLCLVSEQIEKITTVWLISLFIQYSCYISSLITSSNILFVFRGKCQYQRDILSIFT